MPEFDPRGLVRGASNALMQRFHVNAMGDQLVAQGLPPYTELTRSGVGWTVATATAFAPVAAVPTTTAKLEIFNNSSGRSAVALVIDRIYAFQLLGTAATQTYALWACVTTQKAAPTNAALDIFSMSGRPKITTTAVSRIITAVDTTIVANGWQAWGPVQAWGTHAATPGNSLAAEVSGRLIVPPMCSLALTVAGSIATASSFNALGAAFYEAPIEVVT